MSAPPFPFPRQSLRQNLAPLHPSVLLWQAYAPFLDLGGTLVEAARDVLAQHFFTALELPTVHEATHRRTLAQIACDADWDVMVWSSDAQAEEKLNLGSLDATERKRAQTRFQSLVKAAAECGARRFGFCSPPDCEPNERADALRYLRDELISLSIAAGQERVSIVLEALDRHSHKKGLLGLSTELAALAYEVRAANPSFGVTWDSAHAALNGEELVPSFWAVAPHVVAVHFSDAILDREHQKYGDWHIPVGTGDAMKPTAVKNLLLAVLEHGRNQKSLITLAVEEFNRDPKVSGGAGLRRAWNYLGECL